MSLPELLLEQASPNFKNLPFSADRKGLRVEKPFMLHQGTRVAALVDKGKIAQYRLRSTMQRNIPAIADRVTGYSRGLEDPVIIDHAELLPEFVYPTHGDMIFLPIERGPKRPGFWTRAEQSDDNTLNLVKLHISANEKFSAETVNSWHVKNRTLYYTPSTPYRLYLEWCYYDACKKPDAKNAFLQWATYWTNSFTDQIRSLPKEDLPEIAKVIKEVVIVETNRTFGVHASTFTPRDITGMVKVLHEEMGNAKLDSDENLVKPSIL